jgi:hypothetical protein
VRERPHLASVLAIAIIVASVVNFAIIYVVTNRPRQTIRAVVEKAEAVAKPVEIPRPKVPVEEAVRRGDVALVKQHMLWCMKQGRCDLDKDLRLAAGGTNPTVAKVLIAAGAKVNAAGKDRETPLHAAASGGRTGVAQVLLEAGADANVQDDEGLTPLHSAAAWGHAELTGLLLAAGADPNASNKNGETPLHLVASRRVPPLSVYARVARMLLGAGARPNQRTASGATPLKLARQAASQLSLDGNVKATGDANEVVTLLRNRGGVE